MPNEIDELEVENESSPDNSQGNTAIALAQERDKRKAETAKREALEAELSAIKASHENKEPNSESPEDVKAIITALFDQRDRESEVKLAQKDRNTKVEAELDQWKVFNQPIDSELGRISRLAREDVLRKLNDLPSSSEGDEDIIKEAIKEEAKKLEQLEVLINDSELAKALTEGARAGQPLPSAGTGDAVGHIEVEKEKMTSFNDIKKLADTWIKKGMQSRELKG